jgi:hypothetical protein
LLIGGRGADNLAGGADDDILISGSLISSGDLAGLNALRQAWSGTGTFAARQALLIGGVVHPAGGTISLKASEIISDGLLDTLSGDAGIDWFFASTAEKEKPKVTTGDVTTWLP